MKITCLMENTVGNELCRAEHGLSLYVERKNDRILIDTGASGLFAENANKLGVDLTKIEIMFLSHGHYDHGGGILEFHSINPRAKIIMQKRAFGDYWHISKGVEKYIGLNPQIKELENIVLLEGDYVYDKELGKIGTETEENDNKESGLKAEENSKKKTDSINGIEVYTLKNKEQNALRCWPDGNLVLKEKMGDEYVQDNFEHEQYIVLNEKGKSILISGCAHNGILNILEEYRNRYCKYPDVVISGFHMRKKNGYDEADFEVIKETAEVLKKTGILCYTGHCTGQEPFKIMKEIMGEQLQYMRCGDSVEIW